MTGISRFVLTAGMTLALLAPTDLSWRSVMLSVRPLQAVNPESGELATICTTTSINTKGGYWLTAAHCVENPEFPTFIEGDPVIVAALDHNADLAILLTKNVHVRSVRLANDQPHVGDVVNLIGYPEGLSIQYFHGNISSLETTIDGESHMMFDMTACQGNSGSSIVDEHDHIVSVLQIGFGQGCSSLTGGALWRDLIRIAGPFAG